MIRWHASYFHATRGISMNQCEWLGPTHTLNLASCVTMLGDMEFLTRAFFGCKLPLDTRFQPHFSLVYHRLCKALDLLAGWPPLLLCVCWFEVFIRM